MILPAEIAGLPLFAAMPEALRARIASRSADIRVSAGEWIAHEGSASYFWSVLEGEVEVLKQAGGHTDQLTTFEAGEYFGEIPLMLGTAAFAGVRALATARLMRTDPADFHFMLTASSEASAELARTAVRRMNARRDAYVAAEMTEAAIVGDRYDLACHDLRDFLARNQVAYEWLDPSDPGDAENLPPGVRDAPRYPVVILANGRRLDVPTLRELAEGLNLQTVPLSAAYDVAIIGAGPAGLAAAVYGGSEGLRTIMIEREAPGGQAGTSSRIENYLGFPGGVSGDELANRALLQAKRFGTEILVTRNVVAIEPAHGGHTIELDGGDRIAARAVVIATGVTWRKLEADGGAELVGRGVYYGAARTEALGARGKDVFLIGGGNSAGQAAMFFASYARTVTLLVRGPALEKSMSYYLIRQLGTKRNIAVETDTTVVRVTGRAHLERLTTRDERTGVARERDADALFVFIGADADTAWMPPALERDAGGYLRTGRDVEQWPYARAPFPLETSVPGIFAAGDVRSESVKRVASGVGEGSMVVAFIHQYLATSDTEASE
ncbi:MAG TPA: FAD-dependent oxidoreductase [Candidatus Elarobacter sp.]|nr:FAD-dependent oxidoreductase [Candidatus Elarobacter sp.]